MKNALLALSLLSITTFASRAEAQSVPLSFDEVAYVMGGTFAAGAVSASLTLTSIALDGIIFTHLASGTQVRRSVLISNLVFSVVAAAMNAGLVTGFLVLTKGEVTAWTGIGLGASAFNVASAVLSGVVLKSQAPVPVTLTPMVLKDGAGASLSLRW